MKKLILIAALLGAGCDNGENAFAVDMAPDFSIVPQLTHVGTPAPSCCMVTNGGAGLALYLSAPTPGTIDSDGNERPAHGDLFVVSPYGSNFLLARGVPAGGYSFTPDGLSVMYMAPAPSTSGNRGQFSLNFVRVNFPNLQQPPSPTVVVPTGLDDASLGNLGFFTPSGRYFIVGVLPPNVTNVPNLHVIDTRANADIYTLDKGAFAYLEFVSFSDTMIYMNSTSSTVAGKPSTQSIYLLNLGTAVDKASPLRLDNDVVSANMFADGHGVVYLRTDHSLMYFDLRDKSFVKLADGIASFSLGPTRRGPIAYIGQDLSVHVVPKLQQEILALPPGTVDVFSPLVISPDLTRLYYYSHVDNEDSHGILYSVGIGGVNPNKTPNLIGERESTRDLNFFNSATNTFTMFTVDNVDPVGATGDFYTSNMDGGERRLMARGVALGEELIAQPAPIVTPPKKGEHLGPVDFATPIIAPVFATLSNASLDTSKRLNTGARAIVGTLSFGPKLGEPEGPLDPSVHTGTFGFSDDGYVLAYAGGATWNDSVKDYVGQLSLFSTLVDVNVVSPSLTGVSEIGPIAGRAFFVVAPAAKVPGVYFVAY